MGRHMFLALYDHFPDTCIVGEGTYLRGYGLLEGLSSHLVDDYEDGWYGYREVCRHNPLIEAFETSIMTQQTKLRHLTPLRPRRIRDVSR